ncbi:MAG: tail fiber protein [Magnetococcales bacterium]|nr:tail fiber protein [Magnetococcales bacterium]
MTDTSSQQMLGTILPWGGTTIPSGWMSCNGQMLYVSQHSDLFALIGSNFGGDGKTIFALPNFSGRFPRGGTLGSYFSTGGSSSFKVGLPSFPSGPSHTHTVTVSFPDDQKGFTIASDFVYSMPVDTAGSQTATPSASTVLGVGKVQTSPTTPAKIYGIGAVDSGDMCSRTVPVTVNVVSQPSWTASVPHMYPPGTSLPASFIPPYCTVNFIICVQGTMPSMGSSDSDTSIEERG